MNGHRVLLVDDEPDFVDALAKRLRGRGLEVHTANSGFEALDVLARTSVDTVILDLAMPEMDGIETLRRLKDVDPDLQVILLTGHGTIPAGIEAMKSGALDFLLKPFDYEELLEKIREAGQRKAELDREQTEKGVSDILRKAGW